MTDTLARKLWGGQVRCKREFVSGGRRIEAGTVAKVRAVRRFLGVWQMELILSDPQIGSFMLRETPARWEEV
jgi:hypothetical protein